MSRDDEHTDEELRECSRRNWQIMEQSREAAMDFIAGRPLNRNLLLAFVTAACSEVGIRGILGAARQIRESAS